MRRVLTTLMLLALVTMPVHAREGKVTRTKGGVVVVEYPDLTRVWLGTGTGAHLLAEYVNPSSRAGRQSCGVAKDGVSALAWWGACGPFCSKCELEALDRCWNLDPCPTGSAWCIDYDCEDTVIDPDVNYDPSSCVCYTDCWCC